jgi:hypothetical protein
MSDSKEPSKRREPRHSETDVVEDALSVFNADEIITDPDGLETEDAHSPAANDESLRPI